MKGQEGEKERWNGAQGTEFSFLETKKSADIEQERSCCTESVYHSQMDSGMTSER